MSKLFSVLVFVCSALSIQFGAAGIQDPKSKAVGKIVEVKCKAFIQKANSSTLEKIDPQTKDFPLFVNDAVKCERDGYLKIEIYKRVVEIKSTDGLYPIADIESKQDPDRSVPGRISSLDGIYRRDIALRPERPSLDLTKIPNEWLPALDLPGKMEISITSHYEITVASAFFPREGFEPDGREHEMRTSTGKTLKTRASIDKDRLILESTLEGSLSLELAFESKGDQDLKLTSKLKQGSDKPLTIETNYTRTRHEVSRAAYGATSGATSYSRWREPLELEASLNEGLALHSLKAQDAIRLTVTSPSWLKGATILGHVIRNAEFQGEREVTLSFETILTVADGSYALISKSAPGADRKLAASANPARTDYKHSGTFVGAAPADLITNLEAWLSNGSPASTYYFAQPNVTLNKGTALVLYVAPLGEAQR